MTETNELVNYFFEVGQIKRVKRSGWWLAKIKDPETVAEHSFRAALIGYVLATLEKADSRKVALACLVHNLAESRINDLHKVGQRYLDMKRAKKQALADQLQMLPESSQEELSGLFEEFQWDTSKEGIIARDADLLETACQAKEYVEEGYKDAQNWIDNTWKRIRTVNGKRLLRAIENTPSNDWWRQLKKISR